MAAVAARYQQLQDLGVEVISMSVDSIFTHKMWDENELSKMVDGGIPWQMGTDAAGNVGKIYGV
ncbi:MAG TPA: redoxin domain-containing protein, partial [Anaerolineae bacterium]|nr:redoxin domain-containing protein [Anaerolineae bacterium]